MGGGPHRLGLMGGLSVSMSGVKVKMRWNGIYFFFFFFSSEDNRNSSN